MVESPNRRELEIATVANGDGHGRSKRRRYGRRPCARGRGASLPALRHHQAQGHGTRPLDLPHHRRSAWRQDLGRYPAGRRHDLPLHLARGRDSRSRPLPNSQVVHVIDDDADVRQSLAFLLSTAGFAVRVHESAVGFLAALPDRAGRLHRHRRPDARDGRTRASAPASGEQGRRAGHRDHRPRRRRARRRGDEGRRRRLHREAVRRRGPGRRDPVGPRAPRRGRASGEARDRRDPRSPAAAVDRASGRCWTGWSPASRTRSSPTTSASARARSRSTAPTS